MPTTPIVAQTNLQLYRQAMQQNWPEQKLLGLQRRYHVALQLLGNRVRGNGKPFANHLVGTASVLMHCGQAPQTVMAGLLHAAYQQGNFFDGRKGVTDERRALMRDLIGPKVEALVFAYTAFRWNADTVDKLVSSKLPITGATRACAIIRLANHVDDYLDLGMRFQDKKEKFSSDTSGGNMLLRLSEILDLHLMTSYLREVTSEHVGTSIPKEMVVAEGKSLEAVEEDWWVRVWQRHRESSNSG